MQRDPAADRLACIGHVHRPVNAQSGTTGVSHFGKVLTSSLGKHNDRDVACRCGAFQRCDDLHDIAQREFTECGGAEHATPCVEDHQHLCTGSGLGDQVVRDGLRENVE